MNIKRLFRAINLLVCVLGSTLGLFALPTDPAGAYIYAPSNNQTVWAGQSINFSGGTDYGTTFAWTFGDGGTSTQLNPSHTYTATGVYTVQLKASANGYRATTVGITLKVVSPVTINGGLSASPGTIRSGTSTTLSWSTANATQVSISPSVGGVSGQGSTTVSPTSGTTYTLTASNAGGSVTSSVYVSVYNVSVTISPTSANLLFGASTNFSASVSPANQGVSWSATGGYLTGGNYTGTASGQYYVTATSSEDPSKSATATVSVATVSVGAIYPSNGTVNTGNTLQFGTSVSGAANSAVTWSVSGGGSISSNGLFSATASGTYTVTASSTGDPTKSASTSVTVNSVVTGVSINPASLNLLAGGSYTFTASASGLGGNNPAVSWSTNGGSISGGLYTAPITGGTYSVTATSVQDSSKSANATVTVASVSVGGVSPANSSVNAGSTLQFNSSVAGAANATLTWGVSAGGSISSTGLFSAATAGTFTVMATSIADPSKSSSTYVTVNSVVTGVSVNPISASLKAGEVTTFTATVTGIGGNSQAVSWSASGGTVNNGVYTAPTSTGVYTVTARSVQDPSKAASASVSVSPITVSTPSPSNTSVYVGSQLQFSATIAGAVDLGKTWAVSGGGTIDGSGLFTATVVGGPYVVTATSTANGQAFASTQVTVNPIGVGLAGSTTVPYQGYTTLTPSFLAGNGVLNPGNIPVTSGVGVLVGPMASTTSYNLTVTNGTYNTSASATVSVATVTIAPPSPSNSMVNAGGQIQFTALVGGAVDTSVAWSVSGGGMISGSGLFTASSAGTYTVTAKSNAYPAATSSTQVTVNSVVTGLTVTPNSATLKAGESLSFVASVQGMGGVNQSVTWNASGGTMTVGGTFTAPDKTGPITVTATSVQDSSKFASVTVNVRGWVLRWKQDTFYVGTKEMAEVDTLGLHVTLVDHLGSPRLIVNGQGQVEAEQKFLPFGEALADSSTSSRFAKGYTNHEQTDPSGLIYMQARFYAPWYGRFLSPDPARDQHFEETQSWNIYSYVQNNPTMLIDPNGMALQDPNYQLSLGSRRPDLLIVHDTAGQLSRKGFDGMRSRHETSGHLYIDRTGEIWENKPLSQNAPATKAEWRTAEAGKKIDTNLTVNVELNSPLTNPSVTDKQYGSLAQVAVGILGGTDGSLTISPHREIDRGISGGHEDPRGFDVGKFEAALKAACKAAGIDYSRVKMAPKSQWDRRNQKGAKRETPPEKKKEEKK